MLVGLLNIENVDVHLKFPPTSTKYNHRFVDAGLFDVNYEVILEKVLPKYYLFLFKFLSELFGKTLGNKISVEMQGREVIFNEFALSILFFDIELNLFWQRSISYAFQFKCPPPFYIRLTCLLHPYKILIILMVV